MAGRNTRHIYFGGFMDFYKLLKEPQYDFLRTNPLLGDNIILLTLGGSYAYGTYTETSDVDIRGIANNPIGSLLGVKYVGFADNDTEQFVDEATDTTVYVLNKIIALLISCNPNTIEMLGCKHEHYLRLTSVGIKLLENTSLFLSRRAIHSFGGYATAQLRRLTNALARDAYSPQERETHIFGTCNNVLATFNDRHAALPAGSIQLTTTKSNLPDRDSEIAVNVSLTEFPLRHWQACLNELHAVVKDYDKLTKRNHKKDIPHLNKHAMHLIRLYLMGCDILEKEQVITYREKDLPLLMSIRNGDFMKEDGTYRPEFFELLDDCEKRMKYAADNTSLPEKPDMVRINELVTSLNYIAVTSI